MKATMKWALVGLAVATLAACGGGGSGGNLGPGDASVSLTAGTTSLPANPAGIQPGSNSEFSTSVTVRFRNRDGSAPPDGTPVELSSSNSSIGVVSSQADPLDTGSSATATTAGGVASFWFTAGPQPGNVTLTGSAPRPGGGAAVTGTLNMSVTESDATGRLTITGSQVLPANKTEVPIFFGSPYISELTVRYMGPDGNAGSVEGGEIAVAVSPVSRAAFSTLNDPSTDENEFFQLFGNGTVGMAAGQATVFVHSFDQPGTATVTVSAQDASTGENFSETFEIEIIDGGADFLPAQVSFDVTPSPVYIQGSGGPTSKSVSVHVADSAGNPVPNPQADGNVYNNVHLELVAPSGSNARLTGTDAEGNSVNGTEISIPTVGGVAGFSLAAGSETGPHEIIATVDRADNNVDNGLQDPVSQQTTINVGDGRLFSLSIVQPSINSLIINQVANGIESSEDFEEDPETGVPIPPNPDGTYSVRITVQGTDQAGNPTLAGTPINFGKIDNPTTGEFSRYFLFSGSQGDPEEGGLLFTALNPSEGFLDNALAVDDAVEPGDTLALFGQNVPGNREHEAVRFVDSVIDNSTLRVTQPFNPNNQTGQIIDDGAVIPWVVGRSTVGVIENSVLLGQDGRASVYMTYPNNVIGQPVVIWGQGSRPTSAETKTVAAVAAAVFPGVAPGRLTVRPSSVPGNVETPVEVCLTDALGAPFNGATIQAVVGSGAGQATVDGQTLPAAASNVTGSSSPGCLIADLGTSNLPPQGAGMEVVFYFGGIEGIVTVQAPGDNILSVSPSLLTDTSPDPLTRQVTLTLTTENGQPVPGAQIVAESCDGDISVSNINPTGSDGSTLANVTMDVSACEDGTTATYTCTFSAPGGSTTVLTVQGLDLGSGGPVVSPDPCA